jgi:tRNA (guanine37-N1)-methyltransferase
VRAQILPSEKLGERRLGTREVSPSERSQPASKLTFIPKHASSMFTIDVVTLFPELFAPFVGLSVVGRAVEGGIANVRYHHLLDELSDGERADDAPFGGGPGMVLRIEPIARVLDRIAGEAPQGERRAIVLPSPSGQAFTQREAERWAALDRLVIVCGHYEGIDERLASLYPIEEWSLGDFVLTGGELPALAFMDATIRLLDGTLRPESLESESFTAGVLDYPSFTRPATFRGVDVPPVLLSGDHAKIAHWRREQSRRRTAARRKDLLDDPALQADERP